LDNIGPRPGQPDALLIRTRGQIINNYFQPETSPMGQGFTFDSKVRTMPGQPDADLIRSLGQKTLDNQ
jgi:hypothetical protein